MLVTHLGSPRDYISELYFHDIAGLSPPSSTTRSNFCCPVAPGPIGMALPRHSDPLLNYTPSILIYNFQP
jgi:hypothetical protein